MKKVILFVILALGLQQAQAQYKFLQYRNVPEKNEAEFVKRETQYWSKIAKENIKSGKMLAWSLWKKVGVMARKLLIRGAQQPLRILCTREVQKSIAQSVHQLPAVQMS